MDDLVFNFFNLEVMAATLPMLLRGLLNTLKLTGTTIICGGIGGVALCIARLYGPRLPRVLAVGFIDIFRSLPILVVLVLIYYALPFVGIRFNSFTSASLALSMVLAAYTAEVFRAGIEAIPKGQFEAADALGLSFPVVLWKVILPQAVRIATPAQTSNSSRLR
jgi:polar amino acid transport system permease protein